jgi:glycosyltransferase involved in cell wall biosynthesis
MNKVLIVTYYWPPGSGAGVQRWLKFSKYLPQFGWEPVILTVDPGYAAYPATDSSLTAEVSPDLKVYTTKATDWFRIYKKDKAKIPSAGFATNDDNSFTGKIIRFIRGNFFIPDPRRGWNRYAVREASRLIESHGIRYLITTSPPHSTQLIGITLRKKFPQLKWIADLRDPWTDIYYYKSFLHTLLARKIDEYYEKKVLLTADRIVAIGKSLKNSFISRVPGIEEKIEIITNGYDEDDFTGVTPVEPDVFTISYIGTLSDSYPVAAFMDAVEKLTINGHSIKLRFVGSVSSGQRKIISSKGATVPVEFISHVNHNEAIRYMMESSVLLLLIPDHHSNRSIITGKIFEYLASRRPILCIGPRDGDAADIIETSGNGKCAGYQDREVISLIIDHYYNSEPVEGKNASKEFSRESLTKKLVKQLQPNLE